MKKYLFLALLIAFNLNQAHATIYTYVGSNGVSTYTLPAAATTTPTDGTEIAGQLAGNLSAATAARATGNTAAVMATQNALINTGATAISTVVMGVIAPMIHSPGQ